MGISGTFTVKNRTTIWLIPLLCLTLLTTACSSRFSYNFLDWWMSWQVRQHISLDRDQRRSVRDNIREFHDWHRANELPRYAEFMEYALSELETNTINAAALEELVEQGTDLGKASMDKLLAPTTALFSSLSDRQVAQLLENIQETQKDWRDRAAKRTYKERAETNAERWIGSLTEQQQVWVNEWTETLQPVAEESARTQAQWTAQLGAALAERSDSEKLTQSLKQLTLDTDDLYTEEYAQKLRHNREVTLALIVRINNNLTEEQQEHRAKAFNDYIRDFQRWSGED